MADRKPLARYSATHGALARVLLRRVTPLPGTRPLALVERTFDRVLKNHSDTPWTHSPFRPRIARMMPHLRQCDAIATDANMPIDL
jgi:hypothetical protein